MRIDSIELRRYRLPLQPPFEAAWDPQPRTSFETTLVRVSAGGHEGVGSGDAMPGFAGNEHLFVGKDARQIARHAQVIENLSFHYGRMWPLEIALWDLLGKARNEPLWRMLGGVRNRVPVYASTGARLPAEQRAETAVAMRQMGFGAIKLRFHANDPRDDLGVVRAVRDAVGDSMEILVDANQGWRMPWDTSDPWDFPQAHRIAEQLADLDVYWLEEPLHRHAYRDLAALRLQTDVRVAGGEGVREFGELVEYIEQASLDIYQPDVAWSCGITRALHLAEMLQDTDAVFSPHTWGDGLVLLANLHVAAAASTAPFVEYPYDPPVWTPERRDFILPQPILAERGAVTLPEAPGLGVTIDWDAIEQYRIA